MRGFLFDKQSLDRVQNAVTKFLSWRPSPKVKKRQQPDKPQLAVFRRLYDSDSSVTNATFEAIQPIEADGWNWSDLYVDCASTPDGERQPTDRDGLERFTINQSAMFEGCVFPDQLFAAVNLGNQWYAVGGANTSVTGIYSTGRIILSDCGNVEVPVTTLVTLNAEPSGYEVLATWNRVKRQYEIVAFGCMAS